ncbi:proline-rich protein HaeIII subfamily 1-like [Equus asinus]|uniref:proline-rich protein HaeIII subfamily 1-like n=1 Tax=Equus asinus TaxID=9793 RepID=UPI0038F81912
MVVRWRGGSRAPPGPATTRRAAGRAPGQAGRGHGAAAVGDASRPAPAPGPAERPPEGPQGPARPPRSPYRRGAVGPAGRSSGGGPQPSAPSVAISQQRGPGRQAASAARDRTPRAPPQPPRPARRRPHTPPRECAAAHSPASRPGRGSAPPPTAPPTAPPRERAAAHSPASPPRRAGPTRLRGSAPPHSPAPPCRPHAPSAGARRPPTAPPTAPPRPARAALSLRPRTGIRLPSSMRSEGARSCLGETPRLPVLGAVEGPANGIGGRGLGAAGAGPRRDLRSAAPSGRLSRGLPPPGLPVPGGPVRERRYGPRAPAAFWIALLQKVAVMNPPGPREFDLGPVARANHGL